jgi:transposase
MTEPNYFGVSIKNYLLEPTGQLFKIEEGIKQVVKPQIAPNLYLGPKKRRCVVLKKLVACTFLGLKNQKLDVCVKDGNELNCCVDNLEIKQADKKHEKYDGRKLECYNGSVLYKGFDNAKIASEEFGVSIRTICGWAQAKENKAIKEAIDDPQDQPNKLNWKYVEKEQEQPNFTFKMFHNYKVFENGLVWSNKGLVKPKSKLSIMLTVNGKQSNYKIQDLLDELFPENKQEAEEDLEEQVFVSKIKPVVKCNSKGEEIETYKSMRKAAEENNLQQHSSVSKRIVNGGPTKTGIYFRYKDEPLTEPKEKTITVDTTSVLQYLKDEFIDSFNCLQDAEDKTKISKSSINNAIHSGKECCGYLWKTNGTIKHTIVKKNKHNTSDNTASTSDNTESTRDKSYDNYAKISELDNYDLEECQDDTEDEEIWKQLVIGDLYFKDIKISTYGRVFSKVMRDFRTPTCCDEYFYITLNDKSIGVENKKGYIHLLVAYTFLNHRPGTKLVVNHKNLNKKDNRLCNLEIITAQANVQHALKAAGRTCGNIVKVERIDSNGNIITFKSIKDAAKSIDVDPSTMKYFLDKNSDEIYRDYRWRYADNTQYVKPECPFKILDKYPKYEIYENGVIWSLYNDRPLKPQSKPSGYQTVKLSVDKVSTSKYVHILVAEAFLEKAEKTQVNHIDSNPSNNHLSNLEWVTGTENMQHSAKTSEMRKPVNQYDKDGKFVDWHKSISDAGRAMGISKGAISTAVKNGTESSNHYWKLRINNEN